MRHRFYEFESQADARIDGAKFIVLDGEILPVIKKATLSVYHNPTPNSPEAERRRVILESGPNSRKNGY